MTTFLYMIGRINADPETLSCYYASFLGKYPDQTRRRIAATSLLPGGDNEEGFQEYPTRTILAAQWADKRPQHYATAELLYSFEPTLRRLAGQSVLRLTGVDYQTVRQLRDGAKLPQYGWSIDIGRLSCKTSPEYGFRPTPHRNRPSDLRPGVRMLDFQVSIPVGSIASIDTLISETPVVDTSAGNNSLYPVYSGTVSLEHDRNLYSRIRDTRVNEIVFGNGRSFGVVYSVMQSLNGEQFEAFRDNMASGILSQNMPLPDLSKLV